MSTLCQIINRACDEWWKRRYPEVVHRKFNDVRFGRLCDKEKAEKEQKPRTKPTFSAEFALDAKERMKAYWASLSPEKKEARLNKLNPKPKAENQTPRWKRPDQKAYKNEYMKKRRAEETPEEKEARLQERRAKWALLSPEQKVEINRKKKAKRLAK